MHKPPLLSFLAGFADSIAGGGGTISVPSALLAGIPIHTAYGTNKLAMSLGPRRKELWGVVQAACARGWSGCGERPPVPRVLSAAPGEVSKSRAAAVWPAVACCRGW